MVTTRGVICFVVCQFWLSSCANKDSTTATVTKPCLELASKGEVDQRCAIEFAKAEIHKREGEVAIDEFNIHFDDQSKQWVVMAIHDPNLPGGHIFVVIGLDGAIARYEMGM